jgi:CDP-4-dehydro-6-deoxyglucose reductase, E1
MVGTFGDMSTFSFYFGHHMSTIEGGMISTNDEELYHILLSIRSHGWDRDLPEKKQTSLTYKNITLDDFRALYTFYYPGFNLRIY